MLLGTRSSANCLEDERRNPGKRFHKACSSRHSSVHLSATDPHHSFCPFPPPCWDSSSYSKSSALQIVTSFHKSDFCSLHLCNLDLSLFLHSLTVSLTTSSSDPVSLGSLTKCSSVLRRTMRHFLRSSLTLHPLLLFLTVLLSFLSQFQSHCTSNPNRSLIRD